MIVTSCPLTHHSETSSKGSRGTNNTASLPYNGILAPRETHSEVLTIPRRSVLWQLLSRQRICPIRSFTEDLVGFRMNWNIGVLFYYCKLLVTNRDTWIIAHAWECFRMVCTYTHGCINTRYTTNVKLNVNPFQISKKATLIQFPIRRPAETCNYTPFYWLAGMLCWSEEI